MDFTSESNQNLQLILVNHFQNDGWEITKNIADAIKKNIQFQDMVISLSQVNGHVSYLKKASPTALSQLEVILRNSGVVSEYLDVLDSAMVHEVVRSFRIFEV